MTQPLRLQHIFHASAEEIFDAWTNPLVLVRWWAAFPDWDSPGAEVDLRIGGRYRLQMHNPQTDEVVVVTGEYREIDRPHRLLYTWSYEGEEHESLVTVEFTESGGRTTVVLVHTGLPSDESRRRHNEGWRGTFDNLERRILDDEHRH